MAAHAELMRLQAGREDPPRYRGSTSQVPGGPRCERALLSERGGTSALRRYRASMLSSTNWKASTPTTNTNFGAQSHGLITRCLRFVAWITPPRKTRFRMVGRPCPGGSDYPLGPAERFRLFHPPYRLCLAHPKLNIKVNQAALSKSIANAFNKATPFCNASTRLNKRCGLFAAQIGPFVPS
jgi:hypothetical protein